MLRTLFANPSFADNLTKDLSSKINADEREVKKALEELGPTWETYLTEQVEAKVLENRRKMLDETLEQAEEQQKYRPY